MFREIRYYLYNKSFEGIELSKPFLVSLIKWAHKKNLRYDDKVVEESLEIFEMFYNNTNLIEYPINYRRKFYDDVKFRYGYNDNEILSMISTFDKYFMDYSGKSKTKFIALEGIDGSGKTEQTSKLKSFLENKGAKVLVVSFPVYESFFGKEIGYLLSGDGKLDANNVDCKSMSLWYALDRYSALKDINFDNFDYVIFNRYTLSSAVYQSVRNKDDKIVDWIFNIENGELRLPIPDLYLILDVNVEQSNINISQKGERIYLDSEKDVYEKSDYLLQGARNKYIDMPNKYINMDLVNCNDVSGNLKSIESIHELIKEKMEEWNLLDIMK